ncbi:hypothetical protein ScPMuIL_013888 [Solemya velum]
MLENRNKKMGDAAYKTLKNVLLVLFIFYVGIPVFIRTNPWIQNKLVFLNMLRWPLFMDFTKPHELGLMATRNFYLQEDRDNRLGLWHILPDSLANQRQKVEDSEYEHHLTDGIPIILYLHGTSGTRAGWHRVQLYKLLQKLDYHVIAPDYRGYGDSIGHPTEDGVVDDSEYVYQWIQRKRGKSPLFIWGHSLGTGITTKLAKQLCKTGEGPAGIVLEAPFNNILEAAENHPLAIPFKFIPWFNWVFIDTIMENNIHFTNDESIKEVTTPLLILHAKDDGIIPFELAEKLYKVALEERPPDSGPVEFVAFNSSYNYGHKYIFKAPELPGIVRKFIKRSLGQV